MATQKVVVEGTSVTASQLSELFRQIGAGELIGSHIQAVIEHRNPFNIDIPAVIWHGVYELMGLSVAYQRYAVENYLFKGPVGCWSVPVIFGVTPNKVVAAFRQLEVNIDTYTDDLDADVTQNDRDPNPPTGGGSYLVSFRQKVEADEDLKGLSANVLAQRGVKANTLLERLLLGLAYFLATSKHLDEKVWTLCSGSRSSLGSVPYVNWLPDGRRLCVRWYDRDNPHDNLRARAVVS